VGVPRALRVQLTPSDWAPLPDFKWAPLSLAVTLITAACAIGIVVVTLWKDPLDFMFYFGR
jgi:hypothetical protein